MKKAFTLIEMLVVLVLIAVLLALGIDQLRESPRPAYVNSMKNDIINASITEQSIYDEYYEYESMDLFTVSGTGSKGGKYALSQFNSMEIEIVNCSIGTGFFISVFNERIKNFSMTLNSCNQSKIQEVQL